MEEDNLNYLPTVMFRGTPCRRKPELSRLLMWDIVVFRFVAYLLNIICFILQLLCKIAYIWIFVKIWHSLYRFLKKGTSYSCLLCIVQCLRFSSFILYPLSFSLYSPFTPFHFHFTVPLKRFWVSFCILRMQVKTSSGATMGGEPIPPPSAYLDPSRHSPPHLTQVWSWLWTIFYQILPIKKKIPKFSLALRESFRIKFLTISSFSLKESQSFLIYPLKKIPVYVLLLMIISIHISFKVT